MDLKLVAAGLVAVLLTLVVATAFLALHLMAIRTTPAKPSRTTLNGQLNEGGSRMVTPSAGWFLGFKPSGTFLTRTTDGGATWRSVMPPQLEALANGPTDFAAPSFAASYFLDADHAWIAAFSSGDSLTVLATADGGSTWTEGERIGAGVPSAGCCFLGLGDYKLDFLDDQTGWLYTSFDSISSGPRARGQHPFNLYGTTDAGRTWHLILDNANSVDPTLARLSGCYEDVLEFVTANLGWLSYDCIRAQIAPQLDAVYQTAGPGPQLAVTRDGGRSWHEVLLPVIDGQTLCYTTVPLFYSSSREILFAVCFDPRDMVGGPSSPNWISAAHDSIYVTSDAGLTWRPRPSPAVGFPVFPDAENGWYIHQGPNAEVDISRTSDGGLTWNLVGSFRGAPEGPGRLQVFDTNVAIVSGGGPGLTFDWKTTDGGRTWMAVKRPSPPF